MTYTCNGVCLQSGVANFTHIIKISSPPQTCILKTVEGEEASGGRSIQSLYLSKGTNTESKNTPLQVKVLHEKSNLSKSTL